MSPDKTKDTEIRAPIFCEFRLVEYSVLSVNFVFKMHHRRHTELESWILDPESLTFNL